MPAIAVPCPACKSLLKLPDGTVRVLVEGSARVQLAALHDDGKMVRAAVDPVEPQTAGGSEVTAMMRQLVEQFCVILGGDCTYSGRDMRSSHAGLGIDRADFNRLVEVLQVAMDQHGVPFRAQNKLLAKLAPMHREVVTE